jgi:hypothetical protein
VQKLKLKISAELRTKTHAKEKSLGQLLRWVLYHPGVVHLVAREDAHRGLSARLCRRELLSVIYRMVALAMLYKMEPLLLLMYPDADVRHRPYKNSYLAARAQSPLPRTSCVFVTLSVTLRFFWGPLNTTRARVALLVPSARAGHGPCSF